MGEGKKVVSPPCLKNDCSLICFAFPLKNVATASGICPENRTFICVIKLPSPQVFCTLTVQRFTGIPYLLAFVRYKVIPYKRDGL